MSYFTSGKSKIMINKFFFQILFLFFAGSTISPQKLNAQDTGHQSEPKSIQTGYYSKFRISVEGGAGLLTGSTKAAKNEMSGYGVSKDEINKYYNNLKVGSVAGASVHYLFNEKWGVGVKYEIFTTRSNTMGFANSPDNYTSFYGPISENIYTNFIGLSYFNQQKLKNDRWSLYSSVALGLALYRNEGNFVVVPLLIKGNSFAFNCDIGFEYKFYKNIGLSIGMSGFYSMLNEITVDDGQSESSINLNKKQKENLSRLNLLAGIHFNF